MGRGPRASPAAALPASVPGPLLSWAWRRPHCSRPTLASSQPPAAGDSKSVVPATAVGAECTGGAGVSRKSPPPASCSRPSPHSRSSSPPSHCCWKSQSCSGGTHRSPQERCPGSQKSWGSRLDSWVQGAGAQSPGGGLDTSVGAEQRSGGQGWCLSWGGRDSAGPPGTGWQWSDRMRSSRLTTPPGPVCPVSRICGHRGSGRAPAPLYPP